MDLDDEHKGFIDESEDELTAFDLEGFPGADEDLIDEDEPVHAGMKVSDSEEAETPEELE